MAALTSLRSLLAPALLLGCALALPACDLDDQAPGVDAVSFESGVAKDTEGGAFRVMLLSREGLEIGPNDLIARVGFHDPADPLAPGTGIPGAAVRLDAHQLEGNAQLLDLEASYIGDGQYEFNEFELLEAGIWRLEFSIEVGATLDESVAFTFDIGG